MKYSKLNKNEKGILKDFEKGKFKKTPTSKKEIALYRQYAKQALSKSKKESSV